MKYPECTTTVPNSFNMPLFYGEHDAYTQGSSFVQTANSTESVCAFEVELSPEGIDITWARIAQLSREHWSKENPY